MKSPFAARCGTALLLAVALSGFGTLAAFADDSTPPVGGAPADAAAAPADPAPADPAPAEPAATASPESAPASSTDPATADGSDVSPSADPAAADPSVAATPATPAAPGAAAADPTPYVLLAWQLPCGVADPFCPPGQNLGYALDLSVPSLDALDADIVGTCSDWQVDLEWDSPTTRSLIAAGVLTAPGVPAEDHATGALGAGVSVYKYVDNVDCAVGGDVVPGATASDQTCVRQVDLKDGRLRVDVRPGVTYTITGPTGNVSYNPVTGYTGGLPAGDYSVAFAVAAPYTTTVASPLPTLHIAPFVGACAPVPVTPAASGTPQTCVQNVFLTNGAIHVAITSGVAYTIHGPAGVVAYDPATGDTAPVPPGNYSVDFVVAAPYQSTFAGPIPVPMIAYPQLCDLRTAPLVVPSVAFASSCTAGGSYTLSEDLGIPASVLWKVDGLSTTEGTHSAVPGSTITITAAPNGPMYGFTAGQLRTWTHTFPSPDACAQTLAFTGSNPVQLAELAGLLAVLGLAAVGVQRRMRRHLS